MSVAGMMSFKAQQDPKIGLVAQKAQLPKGKWSKNCHHEQPAAMRPLLRAKSTNVALAAKILHGFHFLNFKVFQTLKTQLPHVFRKTFTLFSCK